MIEGSKSSVAIPSGSDHHEPEYVSVGYDLQREPLRLHGEHRDWFASVYESSCNSDGHPALILGAVTWMAEMASVARDVLVVDSSPHMLARLSSQLQRAARVRLVHSRWEDLSLNDKLGVVLGDNSFAFLPFPAQWQRFCEDLSSLLLPGGKLMLRTFSVPPAHEAKDFSQIVLEYAGRKSVNWTELRTKLLFACWNPGSYTIDTKMVLQKYEAQAGMFAALLSSVGAPSENDLETIRKYKNAGAVYYAPPLANIMEVMQKHFKIESVHYGSYELAEYFPLVCAVRK